MTRANRILRGTTALILLAGLLIGVPTALWHYIGWPLPHALPTWAQVRSGLTSQGIPDNVLIKALAIVVWLTWSTLVVAVWAEGVAAARGRVAHRLPGLAPVQSFAAYLVAAVILAVAPLSRTSGRPHAPALVVALQPADRVMLPRPATLGATTPPTLVPTTRPVSAAASLASDEPSYVVQRRDTLWGIAEHHLADPLRWPEIFRLNQGRSQPDGGRLTNPNLIRPGWVLTLPPTTAEPDIATPPARPVPAPPPSLPPTAVPPVPLERAAPPKSQPAPAPRPPEARPATPARGTSDEAPPKPPPAAPRPPQEEHHHGIGLPSGSVIGSGLAAAIAACLAALQLRRRAAYKPSPPRPGLARNEPDAAEVVRSLRRAALQAEGHLGDDDETPPGAALVIEEREIGAFSVGEDGDAELTIDLLDDAVDLDGAGAPGALRALLVSAIAANRPDQLAVVVAGTDLADELLGIDAPNASADVAVDLAAGLARLEVETIRRTRVLAEAEADDYRIYAPAHPEDPLPVLIAVHTSPGPTTEHRLAAIEAGAARLGIGVVGLARADRTRRLVIDADSVVREAVGLDGWERHRLYRLTREEAAAIVATVGAGRGETTAVAADSRDDASTFVPPAMADGAPMEIAVFGPVRVVVAGEEVRTGLRTKARELLAFLATQPEGVTWEAAADALWPDADAARGNHRFRTALLNIRALRDKLNGADNTIVERAGDRYRLNPAIVSSDLWRFQKALEVSANAENDASVQDALGIAANLYRGDFCDGSFYDWAEPIREDLRRRGLDVLVRRADIEASSGNADAAVATLERAIELDPYAEATHQRLIDLYGLLRRPDAARRVYSRLARRLDEIDVDPSSNTSSSVTRAMEGSVRHLRRVSED